MLVALGIEWVAMRQNAAQYCAYLWGRSEGVGSVGGGCGPCTPPHDVASHARTACPSPFSALALGDALLMPNCANLARRRGALRLEIGRTAMQAHLCMGLTPWTLSDGPENQPEME